ncbi:hypothetical protein GCM10025883_12990 [Mobilicoccus caccae]|uniref:HTH lysR-type domain-containing protein n=1 Tax=Mobilicoccus caccae TaxID=1859295 RepID=A0ABQ6IRC1_9MICO|nr:hypothetical protein GCM10025883_12990 [Mobilicoccus caccae]
MIDAAGLRVMKAIADEGSFTGAATALGYSQPAISQMVRRLEQRLGTVLVERVGRSIRLTEAGAVLARHATPVLTALDQAEDEVAAIAGLRAGRVRLMAFPSSSSTLLPRALAQMQQQHPDVKVTFTEAEPPESLAALRDGECDLAVAFAYAGTDVARGEDLDGLTTYPLLEDPVRVALPQGTGWPTPRSCRWRSWPRTRGSPAVPDAADTCCPWRTPRGSDRRWGMRPRTTWRSRASSPPGSASPSSPTSSSPPSPTPTS